MIYENVFHRTSGLYYKSAFYDHIVNNSPLKPFYFSDWCQYLFAKTSDMILHLNIGLGEVFLIGAKLSQKEIYFTHAAPTIVYNITKITSSVFTVFSILEFFFYIVISFIFIFFFFYRNITTKNEEFAGDNSW